ncbi:winged helix-turn-helix transcriptional regulator [archaeon]|jgi:hypothetical protein|nr:winged helix-turn-helix transcriptional regulator [archaeon]
MANKKTSKQIREKIMSHLREGPRTITEISESINSNWLTTGKFLKDLEKDKQVVEVFSSPKMKVYRRTDDPVYYSLPFSKEIRDQNIYLLSKIVRLWKEKEGSYPNKTTTQKIAVEVIEDCELDLPVLEFHYGKVTCMNVSYEQDLVEVYDISTPKNSQNILNCIKKILKEDKHTGKSEDERKMQYEREKMNFYSTKEKLIKDFDNEGKTSENLIELSINFPMKLEKFYSEFNDFVSTSTALLSVDSNGDNLSKIKETFFSLWDLITTLSYFKDAEKFISPQRKELFEQIKKPNLSFKKMGYETLATELKSELISIDESKLKMPQDDESKKIQRLFLENLD